VTAAVSSLTTCSSGYGWQMMLREAFSAFLWAQLVASTEMLAEESLLVVELPLQPCVALWCVC
jgi:hypothetical protein